MAVCRIAALLMSEGVYVFSPIAHTHPIAVAGDLPRGWDFWHTYDYWFVSMCDEVWVLMLEGWKVSKGVNAEIAMANSMGKPVKYLNKDGTKYAGSQANK